MFRIMSRSNISIKHSDREKGALKDKKAGKADSKPSTGKRGRPPRAAAASAVKPNEEKDANV